MNAIDPCITAYTATDTMKIYIRYMVSTRCKNLVKNEMDNLGILYTNISLGEAYISNQTSQEDLILLDLALKRAGLEIMDDKKSMLIEKIKNTIIDIVHYPAENPSNVNLSDFLSKKLGYNYTYLANVFSETQGITIIHFMIMHKIELVKELLIYKELTLTEIAYRLNYSSVAHLSSQFKKITGLSPSHFKSMKEKRRINLEDL